jgi:hypothetical protein
MINGLTILRTRWMLVATLVLASTGCAFPRHGTLCERVLRKTGTGAQTCELQGCVSCDDYCCKPCPCTPKVSCAVAR